MSADGDPQVVVVLGATGGIGAATARAFAARGARLVLVARSEHALEVLADSLALESGVPRPEVVVADVADAEQVDAAFAAAVRRFGPVDVVVHTAAVVAYGRLTDVPAEVWDRTVTVGVLGTSNVARAALRAFELAGGGTLVVVGSVLGRVTTPYLGAYITGKFAVRGLTRVLQQEARQRPGVHVTIVEPGAIDTGIYRLAANYAGRIGRPPPPVRRPEAVARGVLRAVDRRRLAVQVGPANRVMQLGFSLTPWLYDRLVGPLMRVGGLGRRPVGPHRGNAFRASEDVDPDEVAVEGVHRGAGG